MYKVKNNLGPSLLDNIFALNSHTRMGLRSSSDFIRPRVNTVHYGKDSLQYFGSIIWNTIPLEIKNSVNLNTFKKQIRNWSPDECLCRLCQLYLYRLGYINTS